MTLVKRNSNFKRSRGEQGPAKKVSAYSYHNVRSETELSTGRDTNRSLLSENKLSHLLNRAGAVIFLLVCIISLVSILTLSPTPHVVLVGDQSNNILYKMYEPDLFTTSEKLFKDSIFNRNKITVNTNGIISKLTDEFPEFSQISITMPLIGQHPIIYLTQSTPSLVLQNTLGQYLLNNNGIAMIYDSSDKEFNYLKLPIVQDQSGLSIKIGDAALTSQNVSFIQTVDDQLASKGYQISSYVLPAGSSELDTQLAGKPYTVKFNMETNDAKLQAGRYLAVANYFKSNNITPSQYVDVRTDGRVYYK